MKICVSLKMVIQVVCVCFLFFRLCVLFCVHVVDPEMCVGLCEADERSPRAMRVHVRVCALK